MPVGDAVPGHPPAADAVPEHHRRVRAGPGRGLQHVRVHAQAAGAPVLARSRTSPATSSCSTCSSRRSRSRSTSSPRCRAPTRALLTGRIHSRVPATILIAVGAFIPTVTDSLNRFGATELFQLGKFLGVAVPVRRLPRLDRGVPRDPHPVHRRSGLAPRAGGVTREPGRRARRPRRRVADGDDGPPTVAAEAVRHDAAGTARPSTDATARRPAAGPTMARCPARPSTAATATTPAPRRARHPGLTRR